MEIRSLDPFSVGKLLGAIYFTLGLIFAIPFTLFAVVVGANQEMGGPMGFFGAGAIIVLPLFYGVIAFVMGMLTAVLYNVFARMVGGIRIELI